MPSLFFITTNMDRGIRAFAHRRVRTLNLKQSHFTAYRIGFPELTFPTMKQSQG